MIRIGVVEKIQLVKSLQGIVNLAKTGLVEIKHDGQEAEVYFQNGQLKSIGLKEHISLGERLVQARAITHDQLREALLTPGVMDRHSRNPENNGELLIARTLIELKLIRRERLNAWITQEAVTILQDILNWSNSEVYFAEGVQAPIDRFPLDYRFTSLILSLHNGDSTPIHSLSESTSIIGTPSLPAIPTTPFPGIPVTPLQFKKAQPIIQDTSNLFPGIPVTPLQFKKAQPIIQDTPNPFPDIPVTPPGLLPLSKTLTPGIRKFSLPIRPFFTNWSSIEQLTTIPVKVFKREPHLENYNTLSTAVIKGITHPKELKNLKIRTIGALFVVASLFYIPWLIHTLNTDALWFSLPFLFANLYITFFIFITIFNNWNRSAPDLFKIPKGLEPIVAVLIPTYGEPVEMVQKTLESVLNQDWPHEALVIILGDDSHKSHVRYMVENMQRKYSSDQIIYHLPPSKSSPERIGKAKDGNLNSMLAFISENYPNIQFIETRDADDLVGDTNFLRYAVGHLLSNPKVAYVQTIKEAVVSPGDPFGNLQPIFYRGLMLSKHATNSVFPCGSGLVWRKHSLEKIGGFPTWNLVEDLYSGYVALRHGFNASYLPIVGAVGQTAPEDIPNVYKQLGTWALDTVRLFVWKNPWFVKGFSLKQKMHFTELGLYYFSSFIQLIFLITPAICLFSGKHPFIDSKAFIFGLVPFMYTFLIDIFVLFLGDKLLFEETWRAVQLYIGMMFVYMKAAYLAIVNGPNKKPVYKVTRKVQMVGFYFKEVLFQMLLFMVLLFSIFYNVVIYNGTIQNIDFGSIIWALVYMIILSGIISKSWFGVKSIHFAGSRNRKSRF